jgi:anti-sigma regulatory factor (Ser/Thr protein kinase)
MQDELRVAATIENVRRISDFVRDAGNRLRLTDDALFDIDVAVEEASTNIVRHAYGPEQQGDIQVRVAAAGDAIRIELTDWGLPFDADTAPLAVDVAAEVRAEGGMGLLLVHELMDDVTRTLASAPGGPNVLMMIKHLERWRACDRRQ